MNGKIRKNSRNLKRFFIAVAVACLLPLSVVHILSISYAGHQTNQVYVKSSNTNPIQNVVLELPKRKPAPTITPDEMELIEKRMQTRSERLSDKCTEFGLDVLGNDSLHRPYPWEYLVNKKYHLIWCNVFKAASTSWMYNFNILAGYADSFLRKTRIVPLELARKRYPRVTVDELFNAQNNSITFLIARHPFERFLSAYKDKILYALPHSHHDALGKTIIRVFRKKKYTGPQFRHPTFSEFVDYVLHQSKTSSDMDMHWTPITKFCTPCQIHIDVIMEFETLNEDQTYLIQKANLTGVIRPEWKNTGKGTHTAEQIDKYYSQLSYKQLKGLYDYFRYDFELFNYDAQDYFMAYAQNKDLTDTDDNKNNVPVIIST